MNVMNRRSPITSIGQRWRLLRVRTLPAAVLLLAVSSAVAGERDRFLFELDGVPVGTVELEIDGQDYRYTSTHFFARGRDRHQTRMRTASFRLTDGGRDAKTGDVLESLWLLRRPKQGCLRVRSELEGRLASACAHALDGERVAGTIGQEAFTAEYDAEKLRRLSLGTAEFSRIDLGAESPRPPHLFAGGWRIEGRRGALRLERFPTSDPTMAPPSIQGVRAWRSASDARALAGEIHRSMEEDAEATCVEHVRAFADAAARRRLGDVLIVHRLVAERGADRAFPHVWVRVKVRDRWLELDPALGGQVTPETHVAIAQVGAEDSSGRAGRAWLSFAASAGRLARSQSGGALIHARDAAEPGRGGR
jgi:hypothetical protein